MMVRRNKILILIFLLALLLRIIFVFSTPIKFWDETIYINLGRDLSKNLLDYSFSNGWSDFIPSGANDFYAYPKAGFRPPLLPYTISIFYLIKLEMLIDFLLPLVGALSVVLIYLTGKEMFDKRTGIIAASFLAVLPLHVIYSGKVLTDVYCVFFILLALLSFWKGFEKNENKHKILFGIFLALALLARYSTLYILPIFPIYLLIKNRSLSFLKDKYSWYAVIAFILVLIPWFIYGMNTYQNPLGPFIHGFYGAEYWGGQQSWTFFLEHWFEMFSLTGLIFLAAIVYLAYKKDFKKKDIYFLLIWAALFFVAAMSMAHKEDRYILPLVPALILLSANFVSNAKYKKIITFIVIIFSLTALTINFQNTFKTSTNINAKCFQEITKYLESISHDSKIVSENPPLFRYYNGKENSYFPDDISAETLKSVSQSKKTYFVFTRLNSGFETEKWQNLKAIMEKDYKKLFECGLDPQTNWIYSN